MSGTVVARWTRLPLRTQLPVVFAALLLVGLVLTGVTAFTLLRQSLVAQVDHQLEQAVPRVLEQGERGSAGRGASSDDGPPSDYHVRFAGPEGGVLQEWTASTGTGTAPALPTLSAAEVAALEGTSYTVPADSGAGHWRALSRAVAANGELVGSVTVALPLDSVDATLDRMQLALVAIGVVVVGAGAFAGWWGVRRALRPLGEIEATADAFASGDLSRRVPDAPRSTEVGRLAGALNGMLAQIERAFDARSASEGRMRRFVADASHELRTPLATIRGYGELYRMGALQGPEEPALTFRRIEDSATRMGTLVEDLLHLARLDERRPQRQEPVDLAVLATDAVADLRALDAARDARVLPLVPGGTVAGAVAVGDESRLRQVLANLVGNVVQHTPAGSAVEIAVGRMVPAEGAAAQVVLEVRDHGPGIPAEHAARVFERFYRVDAARGRGSGGGAGLGMAIVDTIVRAHGGEVSLATTPGGGTTVRVTLPAAPSPAAAPLPPAVDDEPEDHPAGAAAGPAGRGYDGEVFPPTR